MKKLFFLMIVIYSVTSYSQNTDTTKVWTKGGKVGINASEVGFYNWAKGGDNNVAGTSYINLFANRNVNGWSWENKLDLEYGLKRENKEIWKKTDDRLEFNTKLGKQSSKKDWFYTAYLNFKTQFDKGFDYDDSETISISDFMAPGYLTLGPAADYKPNEYFSAMISPAAYKATFVLDQRLADQGEFGVKEAEYQIVGTDTTKINDGQTLRHEVGANLVLSFKKDIFKNVNLDTKLDLFSNYLENPQNIDVDWQMAITMKVNSFLNVLFKTHLIYDDDTKVEWTESNGTIHNSAITQFKQSLSVGLMYNF